MAEELIEEDPQQCRACASSRYIDADLTCCCPPPGLPTERNACDCELFLFPLSQIQRYVINHFRMKSGRPHQLFMLGFSPLLWDRQPA